MMKNKLALLLLAVIVSLALLPVRNVAAHPHEFVQMQVEPKFNEAGQITGMRYSWLFDELFSAYAVEGHDNNKNGKVEPEELTALMNEILGNIHAIDYFTYFDSNGVVPELARAVPVSGRMQKRQFLLKFELPFKKPISVKDKPLRYAIYDSEFYVAMDHLAGEEAIVTPKSAKNCDWEIHAPEPGDEATELAGSLDKSQSSGTDLGVHFAEWVTIKCK